MVDLPLEKPVFIPMNSSNRNGRPQGATGPETDAVSRVRGALHMTQEEMARELKCSLDTVRKLERGRRLPSHLAIKSNFAVLAQRAKVTLPDTGENQDADTATANGAAHNNPPESEGGNAA